MTCKWYDICPLRKLEENNKISDKWKKEYCLSENNWRKCKRFQAEERGEFHSDNMLPDDSILSESG